VVVVAVVAGIESITRQHRSRTIPLSPEFECGVIASALLTST
jgi:hypothetical protein